MILGMSTAAFTLFHVILSLIGIAAGFVAVAGMLTARQLPGWTGLFLATTVATSVTGFFFHSASFGAPHVVGVISLVVFAATLPALYVYRLAGSWRWIYVVGAIVSLYLNTFVGVVQAFQKIPLLHQFAPLGTEPPFAIAQGIVLVAFIGIGIRAVKKFHPLQPAPATSAQATSR